MNWSEIIIAIIAANAAVTLRLCWVTYKHEMAVRELRDHVLRAAVTGADEELCDADCE